MDTKQYMTDKKIKKPEVLKSLIVKPIEERIDFPKPKPVKRRGCSCKSGGK